MHELPDAPSLIAQGLQCELCVQGFPTLKFFAPGRKHPDDYPGERTAAAMVSYCSEQWARFAPPPEVRAAAAAAATNSRGAS